MSESESSSCSNPSCPSPTQLKLYQTVIFATPVLFTLVLLMLFFMLYLRRRRIARLNSRIRAQFFARDISATPVEQGLSKSFRQRLPTIAFDEKFEALKQETQCSVCLGDYKLNEKLQQLPGCGHTFHIECIDEWLAKNNTCPICRTSLIEDEAVLGVDSLQGNDSSQWPVGTDSRMWEDRVVGEFQDRNTNLRLESVNMESCTGVISGAETTARQNNEQHVVNLERS